MKMSRLALTALSAATFALFSAPVQALGLGRLNVQSSLGEALRAEIDVTNLSAEEAASLQIRIATPETYRAAGVDYHPALAGARVSLSRRSDGRPFLRLVSDRVVTEPFVDVILEMNWASGRLVREYTLLLDPPRTAAAPSPAPAAPIVAAAAPVPAPAAAAAAPAPAPAAPMPAPAPAAAAPAPAPSVAVTTPVPPPPPAPAPAPIPAPAPVEAAAPPPAAAPAPAPVVAERPPAARAPGKAKVDKTEKTPPAERPVARRPAERPDQLRVRPGDTLSNLARRVQPEGVSLDQMLVSMFRANPQAFSGENMNRLRAGAILKVPEAGEAQGVATGEARQVILAQSADFDAYRRRLATGVAAAAPESSGRQAGGRVQASVDDRKQPTTPAPDQLKLSQGAVKNNTPEAKISRDAAAKDASTRVAELSRNLDELKKVQGAAAAAAAASAKAAATTAAGPASSPLKLPVPGPTLPATSPTAAASATPPAPPAPPAVVPPVKPPVVASAPASAAPSPTQVASAPEPARPVAAASAAASAASAVAVAKPASAPVVVAKPTLPPAPPAEEPGLVSQVMDSPYVLPGAAGLALLLGGFAIYRVRARSRKAASETSFMESRLQPDSFFGQSGGQRVDTNDSGASAAAGAASSSMNYSLSQLDAIGDVDPVAEADVYLAYGRDLQAEEILKEAMRTDPNRLAVRTKLLEVYAKRRDAKGFELLATQLFTLTRGEGADWQRAQELGRSLDPENPLYNPGGRPAGNLDDEPFSEPLGASTLPHSVMPAQNVFPDSGGVQDAVAKAVPVQDVDIDLSFDAAGDGAAAAPAEPVTAVDIEVLPPVNPPTEAPRASAPGVVDVPVGDDDALEFDLSDISLDLDAPGTASQARAAASPEPNSDPRPSGFVDLSGLPDDPDSQFNDDGDPLERKLDLADEFRQIGDLEGARDLLHEVIASAEGSLKQKAQTMLDSLG